MLLLLFADDGTAAISARHRGTPSVLCIFTVPIVFGSAGVAPAGGAIIPVESLDAIDRRIGFKFGCAVATFHALRITGL